MKKKLNRIINSFLDILSDGGHHSFLRLFTCCGAEDIRQATEIATILSREGVILYDEQNGNCSAVPGGRDRLTCRRMFSIILEVSRNTNVNAIYSHCRSNLVRAVFEQYGDAPNPRLTDIVINFLRVLNEHHGYYHADRISAECKINKLEGIVIARLLAQDGMIKFDERSRYCYAHRSLRDISFYEAIYAGILQHKGEPETDKERGYKTLMLDTYLLARDMYKTSFLTNQTAINRYETIPNQIFNHFVTLPVSGCCKWAGGGRQNKCPLLGDDHPQPRNRNGADPENYSRSVRGLQ